MVSTFQSYPFGYGMTITPEELVEINELREGEEYADARAANEYKGSAKKKPLKISPFTEFFDYGKAKSGYWGTGT